MILRIWRCSAFWVGMSVLHAQHLVVTADALANLYGHLAAALGADHRAVVDLQ